MWLHWPQLNPQDAGESACGGQRQWLVSKRSSFPDWGQGESPGIQKRGCRLVPPEGSLVSLGGGRGQSRKSRGANEDSLAQVQAIKAE